ncbi:MAG: hypothetical protein ACXV3V_06445 [Actinomycetes bacterium]
MGPGLVCALLAALGYGAASVLQSISARSEGQVATLDPRLLVRLSRQVPYLAGIGLDLLAFGASVVALQTLPLFFVQSVLASSIGVTALIARALGARLSRRDVQALVVLGVGLVLLALAARPESAVPLATGWTWALLAGVVPVAGLGVVAARTRGRWSAAVLSLAAGLSFSGVAVSARTLTWSHPLWQVLGDPVLWAIAGYSLLGALLFAVALQRGAVTVVTALTFAVDTMLPAAVGLLYLGDSARSGFGLVAALGFALSLGGALVLAAQPPPLGHAPHSGEAERAHGA